MDINNLYETARDGDAKSEKALFELLTARFRYLATLRLRDSDLAEEAVQEALMAISKEYKEINIKSSFAAWAQKVLDNRLVNYSRSSKRKGKIFAGEIDPQNSYDREAPNPGSDLLRKLLGCLRKISASDNRYARILNFHYQGYGTDEICRRMGLTATNFYTILSRARSLLKQCLEKGETEP